MDHLKESSKRNSKTYRRAAVMCGNTSKNIMYAFKISVNRKKRIARKAFIDEKKYETSCIPDVRVGKHDIWSSPVDRDKGDNQYTMSRMKIKELYDNKDQEYGDLKLL